MQCITTRYLPPTNNRGARIKAECSAKSIVIPYPYEYEQDQAHRYAAIVLQTQLNWHNLQLVTGTDKSGNYQHVMIQG